MKTFIKAAAIASAAVSICTALAYASVNVIKPIVDSDPPPLAGKAQVEKEVAQLAEALRGIQRQNAEQVRADASNTKLIIGTRQQLLESLLSGARNDYRKYPTQSSRAYICDLTSQIDQLRKFNGLPPMPPC